MRSGLRAFLLLTILLASSLAHADEPALSGAWMATASDGRAFAGTWAAVVAVATPNQALGSWKLVDESGTKVLAKGTWSAKKVGGTWRGSWKARGDGGATVSGKWEADASTLAGAKTFGDMLATARDKTIGGTWTTGHSHGNWWLKPLPARR